jgi:hypothetical protein
MPNKKKVDTDIGQWIGSEYFGTCLLLLDKFISEIVIDKRNP